MSGNITTTVLQCYTARTTLLLLLTLSELGAEAAGARCSRPGEVRQDPVLRRAGAGIKGQKQPSLRERERVVAVSATELRCCRDLVAVEASNLAHPADDARHATRIEAPHAGYLPQRLPTAHSLPGLGTLTNRRLLGVAATNHSSLISVVAPGTDSKPPPRPSWRRFHNQGRGDAHTPLSRLSCSRPDHPAVR